MITLQSRHIYLIPRYINSLLSIIIISAISFCICFIGKEIESQNIYLSSFTRHRPRYSSRNVPAESQLMATGILVYLLTQVHCLPATLLWIRDGNKRESYMICYGGHVCRGKRLSHTGFVVCFLIADQKWFMRNMGPTCGCCCLWGMLYYIGMHSSVQHTLKQCQLMITFWKSRLAVSHPFLVTSSAVGGMSAIGDFHLMR